MADIHLDKERWADLLAGRVPPTERPAILAHLESPCEACEQFLAQAAERGEVDALDGLIDEALTSLSQKEQQLMDEVAFARFERAMRLRGARRLIRPLIAVAAVLIAAIFVQRTPSPTSREKGVGPQGEASVRIEALRSREGKVEPLSSRAEVRPGDALVFEIELDRPACVDLTKTHGGTSQSLIDRPLCLAAGKHVIEQSGQALGLPISAEDRGELIIGASIDGVERAHVTVAVGGP
jgi:hypothetical protein